VTRARLLDSPASAVCASQDEYDVCVIGAGAAGLYLSSRLAGLGLKVAVIDRGPRRPQRVREETDFHCVEERYSGAIDGRDFGLGGSTSRWGGLLVPHLPGDVRGEPAWEVIVDRVGSAAGIVLKQLGWPAGGSAADTWLNGHRRSGIEFAANEITCVSSLYLPFGRKNLQWLMSAARPDLRHVAPDVYLHCTVKCWQFSKHDPPCAREVTAVHATGSQLRVRARRFVIAAGALESTRCALEIAHLLPQGTLTGARWLGRCLGDHLSFCAGTFEGAHRRAALGQLGLWFENGWMRGHRFVGDPSFGVRSFAHPVFDSAASAFLVAREVMRAMQSRRMPQLGLSQLVEASAAIPLMLFDRYARKQLRLAADTQVRLQIDVEQQPDPRNALVLLHERPDPIGRPSLGICWAIRDGDRVQLARAQSAYLERLGALPEFPTVTPRDIVVSGAKVYDAYHPVGTCRLGLDDEAVVDPTLKLRGLANVWLASTAVLPSAGSANPTFSLLCLAEHAVASIAEYR
jgi:2-polyprenyl-6-methoxyphenol hydroxylase-like FAD-dependent oxidoreductase